jgi:hypothetical protein
VLEVVDDALGSATETRKKASKDVDKKFKDAIDALIAYEKKYHTRETVSKKMVEAGEKDKSSSTTLNRLKEKLRVRKSYTFAFVAMLILIHSRWRRNRRRQSSFFFTSPCLTRVPPVSNVSA